MAKAAQLTVSTDIVDTVCVLTVDGVLDSSSYLALRDSVIKAALDEPSAVLVDVSKLDVPAPSAWAVFTSARWHVSTWPDVPVLLVCGHAAGRAAIERNGVARYVPVYPTLDAALTAVADNHRSGRLWARAELPASLSSLRRARELVAETLTAWSLTAFIPTTNVIVTTFVENVLQHTDSSPVVVLESDGTTVTVAVRDNSTTRPARHEDPTCGGDPASGLAIIASLCRAWGSTPTPSGKTVWALVGPENQL